MNDVAVEPVEAAEDIDMKEVMANRAAMYTLLARVFHKEVDETFLGELKAARYPQNSPNPAVNEALKGVYLVLRHAREDILETLAVDYARTFLGSGVLNANAAYPYESVYTSEHALMMQEARDEVLAIYRSQGIDKVEGWTDPEDHIALEFEFMATMCRRCAEAIEAGDDEAAKASVRVQHGFLTAHLLQWAPRFFIDVPRFSPGEFYGAFAKLADAFLADDIELLEDIAEASGIELEIVLEAEGVEADA